MTALLLLAASARAFEEPAVAERNIKAIMIQLEKGDWNDRIHAVHELEYMHDEGLAGLAIAVDDGDWQVRMTAVHAIGPRGVEGAPILKRLLKYEPCPVVRLMTLHNLGSMGPEGEEAKAMGWINDATNKEVNACRDQPGPGRAPWARVRGAQKGSVSVTGSLAFIEQNDRIRKVRQKIPQKRAEPEVDEVENEIVTRDPILPPKTPAGLTLVRTNPKFGKSQETLPAPTKFQRHTELDALLDESTTTIARRGVVLEMQGRSTAAPEHLPWPVAPVPREHEVNAPGVLMADAGTAKTPHDAIPDLLRALKKGDVSTRARAADDLGHLGAKAAEAVPALMAALADRAARVRASAGLALGNIGAEDPRVVPLLTKALKDKSEDVRYAAVLGLSRIDTPEARDAFNRHVSKEARSAIDRPRSKAR